ncbi:pentatricopeptide repeat-containing protein At2g13600-like [Selaginella moellendorffii]|uniref:pentatricopeptide repeat-containing protein At2g13600-like n=1 Tax=Selaginella moellendorffii TaxID=88036 RepID=UPI000D1CA3D4|nr:pentatricopeptide repeat-containing protein At2g13600-like [Selaginella moellendorffii]|eukprot:XP_024534904.1 pentatricopeptide repeat-containing protein At2g13600-like [Selaginella moellendorffii]
MEARRFGDGAIARQLFSIKASVAALKSCTGARDLERGRRIHADAIHTGYDSNPRVASSLINMYGKCGSAMEARRVFDRIQDRDRDVVVWTAMILCYAENGEGFLALDLFSKMIRDGFSPNSWTLVALLKACSSLAAKERGVQVGEKFVKADSLEKGMAIHSRVLGDELSNTFVANSLVNFYAKCGSMVDAARVFDSMKERDVVSWNSLVLGHVENGELEQALEAITRWIEDGQGFGSFNHLSFVAVCKACIGLAEREDGPLQDNGKLVKVKALEKGMAFHSQACLSGCSSEALLAGTMVDMYAKCGSMEDSRRVFNEIVCGRGGGRNSAIDLVVPWTSLEMGLVENGEAGVALELFYQMVDHGLTPNCRTYVAALKAGCGCLEAVKRLHAGILRSGMLERDLLLGNCLVDVYGKCGSTVDAQLVFDAVPTRDSVTWTSLLAGYSLHGDARLVFEFLQAMQDDSCRPNAVALLCVLAACSRSGLVDEGKQCLEAAVARGGIEPGIQHYSCMADLLGRAGGVEAMVEAMPRSWEGNSVAWTMLLDACRKWGNVAVGKVAFEKLTRLERTSSGAPTAAYDLMASLFVASN